MRRTPIKRKSGRTRDTAESLAIRRQYREANPACELTAFLRRHGQPTINRYDICIETHHICGGNFGRIDVVSNLIQLSSSHHRLVEADPTYGRLLCLIAKSEKQPHEINADEFKLCSGYHLAGWIDLDKTRDACPAWLEPYRLKLLATLEAE